MGIKVILVKPLLSYLKQNGLTTTRVWIIAIASLVSMIGVYLNLAPVTIEEAGKLVGDGSIALLFGKIILSFPDKTDSFPLIACSCVVFVLIILAVCQPRGKWKHIAPISLLFGLSFVVGKTLEDYKTASFLFDGGLQLFKTGWSIVGCSIVSWSVLIFILDRLENVHINTVSLSSKSNRLALCFDDHPLLFSALAISVLWLPFLIGSYPGLFMGDTVAQISQWFNQPNWVSDYLNLKNPDILLNSHHPVLHTALMGICVQLGSLLFGSYNFGYFIYILIQYFAVAFTLGYGIAFLKQMKISLCCRFCILVFCICMPIFPQYAVLGTKDTIFACSVLLLFISLMRIALSIPIRKRDWIVCFVAMIGFVFLRNGNIILLALVLLVILFMFRKKAKKIVLIGGSVCLVFCLFSYCLMPALDITPGSKREMLSIPFQQVARCVVYHGDELDDEQKTTIDRILDYEEIEESYKPTNADPVKKTYRETSSNAELISFFKVWISLIAAYPETCFDATAMNCYGYLYPSNSNTVLYDYDWSTRSISLDKYFGFHMAKNPVSEFFASVTTIYMEVWQKLPILSLLTCSATYFWILVVIGLYVINKKHRAWIALFPLMLIVLVGFIGPINASTYLRYMFPLIFVSPFYVSFLTLCRKPVPIEC